MMGAGNAAAGYRVVRSSRAGRIAAIAGLVLLLALVFAPSWASRSELRLLGEFCHYLALAWLWNLLAGYAGLVSVGQHAYVGLGGYTLFGLCILAGVPPLLAIPLAAISGALLAVPVALLIFRLRGAYFAIGTWVIAEVCRLSFAQWTTMGGGSGTSLPVGIVKSIASSKALRESYTYWMALGLAVTTLAGVYLLLRSRHGLALTAIRDNELASASVGIDIGRTRLLVYVATAAMTASIGAMIFLQKLRISPDAAFSVNDWTAFIIFIVVIGGIGSLEGPLIGTLVYFLLRGFLADLGTVYLMVLGLVAIVIMLRAPQGLWGLVQQRFGIELFPLSFRVVPPSSSSSSASSST